MRVTFAAVIAGLAWLGAPALAQDSSPPSENGRYTFFRVQDNFIRLDTRSGQVSHCNWGAAGWSCRLAPDERTALESEIARLQNHSVALKKELLARGLSLPEGVKPEPPAAKGADGETKLPSDAELDQVMTFMEKVWRRLVEMIMNVQRDMLRKS